MRSPATEVATPMWGSPGDLDGSQDVHVVQDESAPVDLAADHASHDAHCNGVGGESSPNGRGLRASDTQQDRAPAGDLVGDQNPAATHAVRVADALLLIQTDRYDDIESVWIANSNRLRSLRQVKGLENTAAELELLQFVAELEALKHQAGLALKRAMRAHPLGPWVKRTVGLGEQQVARLIAAVGDPVRKPVRDDDGEVVGWTARSVSDLRSFCGWGDAERQRRRKGEKANWSTVAKSRAWLCANSCLKWDGKPDKNGRPRARSPYRDVYDDARAKYADAVHDRECPRCGPKGKPAQQGSPLSDGHKHARAIRAMAKAILKDLWREARASEQPEPICVAPAPASEEAA